MATTTVWQRPAPAEPLIREPVRMLDHQSSSLVALVALFSLVLVQAPFALGGAPVLRVLALIPFGLAIGWAGPRQGGRWVALRQTALVALAVYVGGVIVAMLRGANRGVYETLSTAALDCATVALVALFGVMLITSARTTDERKKRCSAVAFAPAVYVAANVAAYALRDRLPLAIHERTGPAVGTPAEMLRLVGVYTGRVDYPLSSGVNSLGAIAAAGFAAAVIFMFSARTPSRRVSFVAAAVCLFGVLTEDSRGAFLIACAVILGVRLARRARLATGLSVIVPVSPVVLIAALGFAAQTGFISAISRSGDDLITGNSRIYLWRAVFDFLKTPDLNDLVGYGALGHISSGVSQHYSYLFLGSDDPSRFTVHNLALQTILDGGYISLAALVFVTVTVITRLQRAEPKVPATALLAVVSVILLAGMTESLPSYLFLDTLALIVLVFGVATALSNADP